MLGGKDRQSAAKTHRATGRLARPKRTVGNGAQELGKRRFWRDLFGDDD